MFLKPKLRHIDVNVDDVPVRNDSVCDVVHGQLQYGAHRTNQRLHLSDHTHDHPMIQTFDDVERVPDVSFQDVIDDFRGVHVRKVRGCGGSQEHNFFWFVELSEGGKRDGRV